MLAQAAPPTGAIFVAVVAVIVTVVTIGMILLRVGPMIAASNQLARERKQRVGVKRSPGGMHQVMSRPLVGYTPDQAVARSVDEPSTNTLSVIATPDNVFNERLNVNAPRQPSDGAAIGADDAEKDLRYHERLATLADLINSGIAPQTEGIEKAFGCTRSGRKDSRYAQIRADLLPLLNTSKPNYPAPLTPDQGREWAARRAELELD